MTGRLASKVCIVTGAGRGIGRAIALEFAREGAKVVVASRTPSTVASVVAEVEALGAEALGISVDVGSREAVFDMVAKTVERFGTVDVLVNNAQGFGTAAKPEGSPGFIPLEDFPDDVWDFTMQTGVKASLWGMQAVFPIMKANGGGKIINFGSGNAIGAMKGSAAYNSTKEAIRSLTRTAAAEWGKYGIYTNTIIPTMLTDSAYAFFEARPAVREKLQSAMPLRRFGDVDTDIGPVAVFLACKDSDFILGDTINVDGGQILRP